MYYIIAIHVNECFLAPEWLKLYESLSLVAMHNTTSDILGRATLITGFVLNAMNV
jgi:hypothetical protein